MAADEELPLQSPPSSSCRLQPAAAVYCAAGFCCALAALGAQGRVTGGCDLGTGRSGCRWSRARALALREKAGELERKVEELRRRRAEDARANEKVAGIFASHEQRWLAERKALQRQLHAVVAAARARETKREEEAEELRREAQAKDEALAAEAARREAAEKRLREMGEQREKEAAEQAAELRKHKAAVAELASAQRQMEADLDQAARLADKAESELREALDEAARLRRDADHKDKILSAMLRKSKIDMEDREMLVREVKMCKARRKQAELEADRWRKMCESRGNRRGSSRSSARAAADHPAGCSDMFSLDAVVRANDTKILFVDHVEGDGGKKDRHAPATKELSTVECIDRYPSHVEDKPAVEEYQGLQEWFQMETEKYAAMIKHRHSAEIEAFTEQLRLKDEKLEAFRWRAVTMDVEATRLRCRIQDLEALLMDREKENRALREQLQPRAICAAGDQDDDRCLPCSPVKTQGTEIKQAERLSSCSRDEDGTEFAGSHAAEIKIDEQEDQNFDNAFHADGAAGRGVLLSVPCHAHADAATSIEPEPYDVPARHSFRCEIEEEKEVYPDPVHARSQSQSRTSSSQEATSNLALVVVASPEQKASACKTDIHALAVSYKIKRLKQQLAVLEKLAAAEGKVDAKPSDSKASSSSSGSKPRSRYQTMMSFLSKHVKRYQSLDDKIDDLCARMEESKRSGGRERRRGAREQSAALGQFLEETFQLQRLVVATGQKLLETQSRITPGLTRSGGGHDGLDMKRLMDVAGALLRDVQRGMEVRIARIIGDLEGTLTFHGILHTTR
ncbi:hypothetical protein PR202_ga10798 [Eleusine coracana subsp. coracana]|uniref:Uncharacterized protein n=1 Tax=Eleusine coracana subsp. coracana TaxID=191504 RepID=A0AAV5C7G9_ELECO|nr:hypothetical protein QOZ80_1AG0020670 [Eleusine coracana subsp. coracana]GJM94177.1 hypothetical protein PR202_ga10798 [Eleusine coracana subsp. coracana]